MTRSLMDDHARPVRRLRRTLLYVAATVVAVGALGAASPPISGDPEALAVVADARTGDAWTVRRRGLLPAPAKRARVCDTQKLRGPTERPPGARVVRPGQDLGNVVNNSPAGRTFYLLAGVHLLGTGQYDQVIPKDGDVFIGAPGAVLDGQRLNRYAFVGQAEDVEISYLTIQNFGEPTDNNSEGVVNHDAGDGWFIHHNTVQDNGGAGVFLGSGTRVVRNCIRSNGQYGVSAYEPDGVRNIVLRGNEIARNNTADWETLQPGCGCTGGGKFWDTRGARIIGNYVHHNNGAGLWADTNDVDFLIRGNYFSRNAGIGFFYEISYNALIQGNTFVRNGWGEGPESPGFPIGAIYLSEAGSDVRAGEHYGRHLRIAGNRFIDNWSGVMAWENPDRFAGSPNNTSSDYTTLVNPQATLANCSNPDLIGQPPYIDDCRWKTQHVRVVNNLFSFDPANIPQCEVDLGCGFNGLVANYGTDPDWSPYQAYKVPDDITFHQDNLWSRNVYRGPWQFMIRLLWGAGLVVDVALGQVRAGRRQRPRVTPSQWIRPAGQAGVAAGVTSSTTGVSR